MKSYRVVLHFHLPSRRGIVNITDKVQDAVDKSGVKEGMVLVNAMNITAWSSYNKDKLENSSKYKGLH